MHALAENLSTIIIIKIRYRSIIDQADCNSGPFVHSGGPFLVDLSLSGGGGGGGVLQNPETPLPLWPCSIA